jgi:hypothetical protein
MKGLQRWPSFVAFLSNNVEIATPTLMQGSSSKIVQPVIK